MKLLIEHGADPNRASDNRTTPIIAAGAGMGKRFQGWRGEAGAPVYRSDESSGSERRER